MVGTARLPSLQEKVKRNNNGNHGQIWMLDLRGLWPLEGEKKKRDLVMPL